MLSKGLILEGGLQIGDELPGLSCLSESCWAGRYPDHRQVVAQIPRPEVICEDRTPGNLPHTILPWSRTPQGEVIFELPPGVKADELRSVREWLGDRRASTVEIKERLLKVARVLVERERAFFGPGGERLYCPFFCPTMLVVTGEDAVYELNPLADLDFQGDYVLPNELQRFVHRGYQHYRSQPASFDGVSRMPSNVGEAVRFSRSPFGVILWETATGKRREPASYENISMESLELEPDWADLGDLILECLKGEQWGSEIGVADTEEFLSRCERVLEPRPEPQAPIPPEPAPIASDWGGGGAAFDDPIEATDPIDVLREEKKKAGLPVWALAVTFLVGLALPLLLGYFLFGINPLDPGELNRLKERVPELERQVADLKAELAEEKQKGEAIAAAALVTKLNFDFSRWSSAGRSERSAIAEEIEAADPGNVNLRYLQLAESVGEALSNTSPDASAVSRLSRQASDLESVVASMGENPDRDPRRPLFRREDVQFLQKILKK